MSLGTDTSLQVGPGSNSSWISICLLLWIHNLASQAARVMGRSQVQHPLPMLSSAAGESRAAHPSGEARLLGELPSESGKTPPLIWQSHSAALFSCGSAPPLPQCPAMPERRRPMSHSHGRDYPLETPGPCTAGVFCSSHLFYFHAQHKKPSFVGGTL